MRHDERLAKLWDSLANWSRATFGADTERGPVGPLKHLAKEAQEAIASPGDASEYADCFILVCDAARRSGMSLDRLLQAVADKLEINRQRHWPAPVADQAIEHLKDEARDELPREPER